MLRKIFIICFFIFAWFISIFVPKNKKKIIILTLFDNFGATSKIKRKLKNIGYNVSIITINNFTYRDILKIIDAKIVIQTHLFLKIKMFNQIWIYIDHGVPMKNVVTQSNKHTLKNILIKTIYNQIDYFIVDSIFTSYLYKIQLSLPLNKFKVLGNPILDEIKLKKLKRKNNKYIFTYLPTWRHTFNESSNFDPIKLIRSNETKINEVLKKLNAVLYVKGHPVESNEYYINDKIIYINDNWLKKRNMNIYDLLNITDVLISDYSSVSIQWYKTNRKIIFFIPDFEEYNKKNGFTLQPILFWMAGPKIRTLNELLDEMKNKKDTYKSQRECLSKIYFKFKDNKNIDRLVEFIKKIH